LRRVAASGLAGRVSVWMTLDVVRVL